MRLLVDDLRSLLDNDWLNRLLVDNLLRRLLVDDLLRRLLVDDWLRSNIGALSDLAWILRSESGLAYLSHGELLRSRHDTRT